VNATVGQIVLLFLALAFSVYVFSLRTPLTDRVATLVLALAGIVLIVRPSLSSDLAHLIGIGRGTDLVFYLFIIFCLFRFVSTSAAARRQEQRLAEVVRELALRDARPPATADDDAPCTETDDDTTVQSLRHQSGGQSPRKDPIRHAGSPQSGHRRPR
jgi:hypothetical protein